MTRGARLVILLLTAVGLFGCGDGENVPLMAPGGSSEWPHDPGWSSPNSLLSDGYLLDGIWNQQAAPGQPQVVLVGSAGHILEFVDGAWLRQQSGDEYSLNSVVQPAPGEFLAVGIGGRAFLRVDGNWVREETGTENGLDLALVDGDRVWAVGGNGTVQRREAGAWTSLPSAGARTLVAVAALNDSLFVADSRGRVRIWDNETWSDLPGGPWLNDEPGNWGEIGILGLAAPGDGRLYAISDSVYVREPTGWRTITDTFLNSWYQVETRVVGQTIWYGRDTNWWRIDPAVAPWQPKERVPYARRIMAVKDPAHYLVSSGEAAMAWIEDGEPRRELAGILGINGHIWLDEGGMFLHTDLGVVRRTATESRLVLGSEQIPLVTGAFFRAGCGSSPNDYYIVGTGALYHCVGDQATLLGTWEDHLPFGSLALSESGELYAGNSWGLYHWQGTSWQRVLPLLEYEGNSYTVWPVGDGRLAAIDQEGTLYYLADGLWVVMAGLDRDAILLAGEDGSLFALSRLSRYDGFAGGNGVLEYDEQAGAFRDAHQRGMGPLAGLEIEGASSRNGEVLVWTSSPAMVFSLQGSPAQGDWQVVAGPLDTTIRSLERLSDGSLLAWIGDKREFSIYRP